MFDSVYQRVIRVIKEWSNVDFTEMPNCPSLLMFVLFPSIAETKRRGWKIAQFPDVNGVMLGLAVEASLLAMLIPCGFG